MWGRKYLTVLGFTGSGKISVCISKTGLELGQYAQPGTLATVIIMLNPTASTSRLGRQNDVRFKCSGSALIVRPADLAADNYAHVYFQAKWTMQD
jgi:hypothetical protein